jgi:HEAT repeat protein
VTNPPKKQNISIQQVLAALLDDKNFFPPVYLRQLSDLEGDNLTALRSIWPQASANRRFTLLEDLEEMAEDDTLVSFDNVARMALDDSDPRVRTVAIRLLWECDDHHLVPTFLKMLEKDPDAGVRAAAATALSQFVYLGELEEIPERVHHQVEDRLLAVLTGNDETLVRRRALEALGFSGREEVPPLIRKSYDLNEPEWLISALFAMGHSADNSWGPEIVRMLRHPQTEVQVEAVRAAGELELETARRPMLKMLDDELQDSDVRDAIYWSLSQIGGEEVREALEQKLEDTEDDEETEILEEALENLDFTDQKNLFELMDIDDLPEEDETMEEFLFRHNNMRLEADIEDLAENKALSPSKEDEDDQPGKEDDTKSSSGSGRKRHHPRK